jgi:hypothetical protein
VQASRDVLLERLSDKIREGVAGGGRAPPPPRTLPAVARAAAEAQATRASCSSITSFSITRYYRALILQISHCVFGRVRKH